MKLFSATLLAAFASCAYGAIITEQQQQGNQQSAQVGPGPVVSQFAEARDTSYGVPTTTYSDSGFSSYNSKPITYSSGHSVYSNDPGFSFGGSLGTGGAHVQANSLLPTNNLIETGLSIVLGIFALSLVMQIITRIMGSSLFDKFLGNARHMSSDDIVHYTNMAMKAYKKYEDMNKKE